MEIAAAVKKTTLPEPVSRAAKEQARNNFPICSLSRPSVGSRLGETSYVKRLFESFTLRWSAMPTARCPNSDLSRCSND